MVATDPNLIAIVSGGLSLLFLVVWIVGIVVLLPQWATHRNRAMFGTIGFGIFILASILRFASSLFTTFFLGTSADMITGLALQNAIVGFFNLIGWGFIIAALLSDR